MYQIELSDKDIQLIMSALAEAPLKVSFSTFTSINRQVGEQDKQEEERKNQEAANK